MFRAALAFAAVFAALPAAAAPTAPSYAVVDRIKAPDGGWDFAGFDPASHRLFVARSGSVTAIDVDTGRVTPDLVKIGKGHAALPVPGTTLVLATDGDANEAVLFEGATGEVAARIPVGKKPDAAAFDPATGTLWVMNADSGDASVIDLASRKVVATLPIGGSLESVRADGQGRLFVNVEDKAELVVIDTRARRVLARHALTGCKGPTGLAYDEAASTLVSACVNGVAKLTGADGRDLGALPIGPRPDDALYDPARKLVFVPTGGDGALTVIGAGDAGKLAVLARVPTAKSARTGALDPQSGRIYLPSAAYGPPPASGGRGPMTPGSFAVLVVAPR